MREGGEGFGVESGDGFEREVERRNEVGDEGGGLKGDDEVELGGVQGVGAGFQLLPHLLYR